MKQWIKKLSGAVIASLLALTLSSKAYANSPEAVSDEGSGAVIEEHNTAAGGNVIAEVKTTAAETAKPVTEAAKPAAAEAAKPAPAEAAKPAAAEEAQPAVAEAAKPAVVEAAKPAANEEAQPDAAEAAKPATAEEAQPAAAEVAKPAAAEEAQPAASEAAKPPAAEEAQPAAAEAAKPAAAEEAQPAAAEEAKPAAAEETQPAAAEDVKPAVIENTNRVVTEDIKNSAGLSDITSSISLQKSAGKEPVRSTPIYELDDESRDTIESTADVNIESTGVTIVGKITSGGNVNITGTGIMLINNLSVNGTPVTSYKDGAINTDTIEHFFLTPLDVLNGSVAVFLHADSGTTAATTDTSCAGTYVLINGRAADGSVKTGILNEQYVVPDGINLIMPSGTSIELTSPEIDEEHVDIYVKAIRESLNSEDNYEGASGPIYGQKSIVTSCLTIPEGSTLTVSSGAKVKLSGKILDQGKVSKDNYEDAFVQTPVLDIKGTLDGDGNISTGEDGSDKVGIVVLSNNNFSEMEPDHPIIDSPVSIDPDIFRIYVDNAANYAISFNKQHYELSSYVYSKRDSLSNSSIIFLPKEPHDSDYFGEGVFTLFAFSASGKAYYLGSGDFDSTDSFKDYSIFHWWITKSGNTGGGEINMTSTSSTGTGILGGRNAGAISMILKVTDEESYYNLSAYIEEKQIFKLNSKVMVRFDYPVPTAAGQLFVVFRNEDDSLTAFPARYDAITGELVFSGDKLGNFVVVSTDYNGKLYTKEFYAYLETFESVRNLKYGL